MLRLIVTITVLTLPALAAGGARADGGGEVAHLCSRYSETVRREGDDGALSAEAGFCDCLARTLAGDPATLQTVAQAYTMLFAMHEQTGIDLSAVRRETAAGTLGAELTANERKEQADLVRALDSAEQSIGSRYRTNGQCPA